MTLHEAGTRQPRREAPPSGFRIGCVDRHSQCGRDGKAARPFDHGPPRLSAPVSMSRSPHSQTWKSGPVNGLHRPTWFAAVPGRDVPREVGRAHSHKSLGTKRMARGGGDAAAQNGLWLCANTYTPAYWTLVPYAAIRRKLASFLLVPLQAPGPAPEAAIPAPDPFPLPPPTSFLRTKPCPHFAPSRT